MLIVARMSAIPMMLTMRSPLTSLCPAKKTPTPKNASRVVTDMIGFSHAALAGDRIRLSAMIADIMGIISMIIAAILLFMNRSSPLFIRRFMICFMLPDASDVNRCSRDITMFLLRGRIPGNTFRWTRTAPGGRAGFA